MLRRWEILDSVYKNDDFYCVSAARKIGDDLLTFCLEKDYDENSNFLSTGIISQENLFTRFSSNEELKKSLVPYYTFSDRCIDVTNDDSATPDYVNVDPIIEESA